jgi:GR25 family glycosyltransferase involved in LPS biosynthesis
MNIPIFCINLERATERKEKILKKWVIEYKLDIIFWKAYDKLEIEKNNYIYSYDLDATIIANGRPMNTGEIACATSFCMLYEYALLNNLKEIIVMEDDASPVGDIKNIFKLIEFGKEEFPESQIFLLFEPDKVWTKRFTPEEYFYEKKQYFSLCKNAPWGNQLIYLNNKGIKVLYDILKHMTMPADKPHQKILCDQKIVSIINDPLAKHNWSGYTYIGNEYRKTNRKYIND